ncbi:MAG: hypothetical protein CL878_09135 [Dehalococcoidia bacterium]|nr:hypothetical protein [Dehalococcoidia bacterium]
MSRESRPTPSAPDESTEGRPADGPSVTPDPSVTFLPDGQTYAARAGESVLDVAQRVDLYIETDCDGQGTCGRCALRVVSTPPEPADADKRHLTHSQLEDGWRLSCQLTPQAEQLAVQLVHQLQSVKGAAETAASPLVLRPRVRKTVVQLETPTLHDQRDDITRLQEALRATHRYVQPTPSGLRALPAAVRAADGLVTAITAGGSLVGIEPGDTATRVLGLAFDIGTTTVVGTLVDLVTGQELATAAMLNPQVTFGADVISRINRAIFDPEGLARLHAGALTAVAAIARRTATTAGVELADIWEMTFVGNTSMLHMLLGIDPQYLAPAPYIPAVTSPVTLRVSELWSPVASGEAESVPDSPVRPEALCYVLPGVASFVGADTVAVALATGMAEQDTLTLAIDAGTNGEILLGSKDGILACATAAGPAFEGAQIRHGMRATTGAIERVSLSSGEVELGVVGDDVPRGICGSGLVDAIAELRRVGLVNEMGRLAERQAASLMVGPALANRLRLGDQGPEFVLAPGAEGQPAVTISQADIRQLQLAKGAIRAGADILLKELEVGAQDLAHIYLAGAFGSYLSPKAALAIGLLPPVPSDRVQAVGNAAGRGSRMALASVRHRRRAEQLATTIRYVELSARPDFQDAFMEAMLFPSDDISEA